MKTINEPTKLFNEVEFPSVTLKTKDKLDISHIPKKSQRRGIAMKQKQDENKGTPLMNPDRIKQKKEKSNFFENWDKVIRATSFTKPSTPYDFPNGSQDDRIKQEVLKELSERWDRKLDSEDKQMFEPVIDLAISKTLATKQVPITPEKEEIGCFFHTGKPEEGFHFYDKFIGKVKSGTYFYCEFGRLYKIGEQGK